MNIIATIEARLRAALEPVELDVRDDSQLHYGHDGVTPGQVSHVAILVVSDAFSALSRVERSRLVHSAIAEEVRQIHALTQLKTLTPEEYLKL